MKQDDRLGITVVIPTFSREKILERALAAYREQSLPQEQFEIIVVDDGSTDGTRDVVAELQKTQPNILYFRQEHSGPAKARNLGIEKASSELILFTGDDCIPHPSLLGKHLQRHSHEKGIAVLGNISWHPDVKVTPFMTFLEHDVQFSYASIEKTKKNVPFRYFYSSNISLPKEYISLTGGFDEDFKHAVWEDIELGYRLWKAGLKIVYEPHAVVFHNHSVTLEKYLTRQYQLGFAGALLYTKHPELCELVPVTETVNPEIQYKFYHATLDYYYFMGIQQGLIRNKQTGETAYTPPLIPLEERLNNWNSLWLSKLHERLLSVKGRLRELEKICLDKDFILKAEREERTLSNSGKNVATGDLKEQLASQELKLRELQYFEKRVKSTLLYKVYKLITNLFCRKS